MLKAKKLVGGKNNWTWVGWKKIRMIPAKCSKFHYKKGGKNWWGSSLSDTPPSSLMDSTVSPKVKTTEGEGEGIGARSLVHNTSGVEGRVGVSGWD